MFNFQGVGVYGYNMLCQVIYVEFMVYDWVGAGYSPIVLVRCVLIMLF